MPDPFRNYDSWLTAPYERMAAQGEAMEAALEALGIDIDPPHKPEGDCPRCGEFKGLALDGDRLYCAACDEDIDPAEEPTFEPDLPCRNGKCGRCERCDMAAEDAWERSRDGYY